MKKSSVAYDNALFLLLSLFDSPITDWLFCADQNDLTSEKKMHFGIKISFRLYIRFNTEVTTLDKGLAGHWGPAIINLAL